MSGKTEIKRKRRRKGFIICALLLIGMFFPQFSLKAQKREGIPSESSSDQKQLVKPVSQSAAREFFPYQADIGDQMSNQFPVHRIFQDQFTIRNTGPSYKNKTILWCYIPFSNGYNQIVPKVSTTEDARLFIDSHGNCFLRFDLHDILPYATRIIRVDCEVSKGTDLLSPPANDRDYLKDYLQSEPLLEADHPQIIGLAKKLKQKDPYQTAKKISDWVADNIAYSGFDKQDKGALYGMTYKKGDCTEQAALFTALCRANGIPAKLIWGYRCPGNCKGDERLHTWSEFYSEDVWHLADITNRVFDKEIENYIGLNNYHTADSNPLGKSHRYHLEFTYEDVKTRIDITSVVRLH